MKSTLIAMFALLCSMVHAQKIVSVYTADEHKQPLHEVTMVIKGSDGSVDTMATPPPVVEFSSKGSDGKMDNFTKKKEPIQSFTMKEKVNYEITFVKRGYLTKTAFIDQCCNAYIGDSNICFENFCDVMEAFKYDHYNLVVCLEELELNRLFTLDNIYYDYDKDHIRPDAARELDKLFTLLEDNPAIVIELYSHTDARGSDSYNLDLSQRRAENAVAYLHQRGVPAYQIRTGVGFGETKLVNSCTNGKECSEMAHQQNRRTEIKIVAIDESKMWHKEYDTRVKSYLVTNNGVDIINSKGENVNVQLGKLTKMD